MPLRVAFVEDIFLRWERFLNNSWLTPDEAAKTEAYMLTRWESYIDTYAKFLMAKGAECTKYVPSRRVGEPVSMVHHLGHKVVRVPVGHPKAAELEALNFTRTVQRLARKDPPDLVHYNTYYSRFFVASGLRSIAPHSLSEYSGGALPTSSVQRYAWKVAVRRALKKSDGVLVSDLSELDREEARVLKDVFGVPPDKIFSFPVVAVDEHVFYERDRADSLRRASFHGEELNVVVVSGMTKGGTGQGPTKDPMLILEMFLKTGSGRGRPWHLHFVGFGPAYREMTQEVSKLKADGRVTFHGLVDHEKLPYYYSASELVVYPFPQTDLSSGTAVNEALACSRPVVCFAKAPKLALDQEGGFLVDPSPQRGAEQLTEILGDEGGLRSKGKQGPQMAEPFLLRNVGPRLLEIYDQVLGGKAS